MPEIIFTIICLSALGFIFFTFLELGSYKKINKRLITVIDQQKKYIDEAELYIEHQYQVLNEWSDEYNSLVLKNNEYVDLLEEYLQIGNYAKPKFDSIKEIDDLLIKLTTKEFIRHMAWKKVIELKATNKVIDITQRREINNKLENINKEFQLIFPRFTDKALTEIDQSIEQMKIKLLKKYEI